MGLPMDWISGFPHDRRIAEFDENVESQVLLVSEGRASHFLDKQQVWRLKSSKEEIKKH